MKILISATVQSHICQFHKNLIIELRKKGFEVHVAAKNNLAEKNGLVLDFADKVYDVPFVRSPFKLFQNVKAYFELKKILEKEKYDIIHCNTPMGGVITRLASRKYRKNGSQIIYMAHGFHFFRGAPLKNWLFYYPIEWILSFLTDVLITINKEDYHLATKKFHANLVKYVPGIGIDISKFKDIDIDIENKRKEVGIPPGYVWLLSVGELLPDKNHESILDAISNIPNIYYTIAGNGRLDKKLTHTAEQLKIIDRFKLLGYRRDVPALCKAADIFAFPSKFEGLPVALMEAMASGLAIICSNVRGCSDLIDVNGGELVTPYNNITAWRNGIKILIRKDKKTMRDYNWNKLKAFSKEEVICSLLNIYRELTLEYKYEQED